MNEQRSFFEQLGGDQVLEPLLDAFYNNVYAHPMLSPLFDSEMEEVKRKQRMFLTQFLGGPPLFSMEFGHPMMRARHMRFPITPAHAEAWLGCMEKAMDEIQLTGPLRDYFFERLTQTAYHMVNTN
jgi:hemoglobin